MWQSRFSEVQISGVLREQEAGMATVDRCGQHGISAQTFYRWQSKYGGMTPSDASKLKPLEDAHQRLKRASFLTSITTRMIIAIESAASRLATRRARLERVSSPTSLSPR